MRQNGTDIKSDIATEKPSNNRLESKANEASALNQSSNRAHVDHKDLKFLKHVRSQGVFVIYVLNCILLSYQIIFV